MELYQIRYFLAVSRTLNFTQAADECNVTQPALTRAIKKLEDELGGELFRRERNRSHLTELGKAMVPLLQQSHDAANAAKAEAEIYGRGEVAPLRIGISETVSAGLLARVFAELRHGVTGLDLALVRTSAGRVVEMLQAGEIDFGILAATAETGDRIRDWPLFDEDFVLCGPKGGKPADLAALQRITIVSRPYCENQREFEAHFEAEGVALERKHSVSCDGDLQALIADGEAGAILPKSTATRLGYSWVELTDKALRRTVAVIEAAGRQHNAAAAWFLRLVRAADWSDPDAAGQRP